MQQIFWAAHIAVAHTQKNIKSYGLAARWRKLCGQRNVAIFTAVGKELTPDDLLPRHPHFPFQTRPVDSQKKCKMEAAVHNPGRVQGAGRDCQGSVVR